MTDQTTPALDLSAEAAAAGPIDATVVLGAAKRPDITPAQIIGIVPVIADLGHTFGVFTLSAAQQHSLTRAMLAGMALFGADAIIRLGRNLAHGRL